MMGLYDDLLALLPAADIPIREIITGVHWTAVCSLACGLAASFTHDGLAHAQRVRDVGSLHLKSTQSLAEWVRSDNLLEASIGLAAFNSALEVNASQAVEVNASDLLVQRGAGKNVVMVGHFPFADKIRQAAGQFSILEKKPQAGDFPAEAAPDLIPKADVVAITGTTLINHTLESLLPLCAPQALVVLLGPSTPLTPKLFDYGVDLISGTLVVDEAAALLTIKQGAVFPQVRGTRLVTLARPGLSLI